MSKFAFVLASLLALSSLSAHANLLLTEIHYNGPGAGVDIDEFLELTNVGSQAVSLDGYYFSAGINFVFDDFLLSPFEPLVLAKDPDSLGQLYSNVTRLFTFTGALSNSGETIALSNASGDNVFSLSYDDKVPWPTNADGGGDSLQLAGLAGDWDAAESWISAAPTPGVWSAQISQSVPVPNSLSLVLAPLLIMGITHRLKERTS